MKGVIKLCIGLIVVLILVQACHKKDPVLVKKEKLSGRALKGPFINGTVVELYELNSELHQTGNVFNTVVQNDVGSFEFSNISLISPVVEIVADGYYFNEITGELSTSTLSLSCIADINNSSDININIITHLEKDRVKYLITQGKSFSESKHTAEMEVLRAFGIELNSIANSEMLNFSEKTEGNAVLLALSVILQGERSVADMTELISTIAKDLKEDGAIGNEEILNQLRSTALSLDQQTIRSNIEERYRKLGFEVDIPEFEKYVDTFLSFTGVKPEVSVLPPTDLNTTSVTLNGTVIAGDLSTTVNFEYGLTDSYGSTTSMDIITGHYENNVSAIVTNLNPRTTYHYRIKAENSKGIVYSSDSDFLTLGSTPEATTLSANEISSSDAGLNGSVNPNYLSTEISFEYGTTTDYGSTVNAASSPLIGGTFTNVNATISNLLPGTSYHFRIRATNIFGTTIGSDQTFLTHGIIKDIDNNSYETVIIGSQTWMAENLKTTRLSDGTTINEVTDNTIWSTLTTPGFCYYNNDIGNKDVYGTLYNGYAVLTTKLCPTGWHAPNGNELIALSAVGVNGLREAGLTHWLPCVNPVIDCNATNSSGFRALPGGSRSSGVFTGLYEAAYFWSSSDYHIDRYYGLWLTNTFSGGVFPYSPANGFSVRCVKD